MRDMMNMGLGERTVTVNRKNLLEKLRENRDKHQREYRESLEGYRALAQERLVRLREKALRDVEENFDLIATKLEKFDPEDEDRRLGDMVTLLQSMSFSLKVPQDHTRSYDVAIEMAEWEVNETVELMQSQFQCFVLDDWEWQQEFKQLNKTYASR